MEWPFVKRSRFEDQVKRGDGLQKRFHEEREKRRIDHEEHERQTRELRVEHAIELAELVRKQGETVQGVVKGLNTEHARKVRDLLGQVEQVVQEIVAQAPASAQAEFVKAHIAQRVHRAFHPPSARPTHDDHGDRGREQHEHAGGPAGLRAAAGWDARMSPMPKLEIVTLHARLYRLRLALHERGIGTPEDYASYEAGGVFPQFWHKDTGHHRRAVSELARCIERALTGQDPGDAIAIPKLPSPRPQSRSLPRSVGPPLSPAVVATPPKPVAPQGSRTPAPDQETPMGG